MKRVLGILTALGLGTALYATSAAPARAADLKNLKVYPPGTSKKAIKKDMKKIARALGVQCDFCHDMKDMSKDTKHKKVARQMMRMTASINQRELKKYEAVTCNTCHQGKEHPSSE